MGEEEKEKEWEREEGRKEDWLEREKRLWSIGRGEMMSREQIKEED